MSIEKVLVERFGLIGRKGIVTGGSSGIGKSIAITLSKAGAEVSVLSRTGKFKNDSSTYNGIKHVRKDITDYKSLKETILEIGKGGIDFLVNNAGTTLRKSAQKVDAEDWNKIQSVNIESAFNLCKLTFPYLRKSSSIGRIVNITSMTSHLGFEEIIPYTTSKTALLGLTRSLAVEWAKENILVNSVSPGWIKTDLLNQVVDAERERKILNRMPLHKYGNPEDISYMVLFLLSPAAKYITGQDFAVDGGALAFGF
jgi:2-deoxy-D-gluconate 3-dehydrogenase